MGRRFHNSYIRKTLIGLMKQALLLTICVLLGISSSYAQCTTGNATSCQCKDGSTNCDLLPNIIVGDEPLYAAGYNGVIEYSQTGNGVENGRLRISVSTPNIGYGPLTVRASSIYLCGSDTFLSNPGTCPDGSSPHNLIFQRIYHKNGNTMSYSDRPAGSMTYHPTHNHMHVDDWGIYTLRKRDTLQPNPLLWPVIGNGAKLGFCLMDYGTCSYYAGHCQDSLGNVLTNANFANFGLGGGNYNCSPTEQGISAGYTDIYFQYLDGMYINLPPTTCNGDYYIVVQIDPHDYFLEENENDNVLAIPYTLTKQLPAGTGSASISVMGNETNVCEGTAITLTANVGNTYLWSTGDTTQSISVTQPGNYTVNVNSICGSATSPVLNLTNIPSHVSNVTSEAICEGSGQTVTLQANGTGTLYWYSSLSGDTLLNTGSSYSLTPSSTTTLYVQSNDTLWGATGYVGPANNTIGTGGYYSNDQHQLFNVFKPIIIKSVKVYANSTKDRIIQLRNSAGTVLISDTINIAQGTQVVPLNFNVAPGTAYQLGWAIGSQPDLYRNSTGGHYPYTLSNLLTVTGNSASDTNRWYCFYNWEIQEQPVTCSSVRVPVTATVNANPTPSITPINNTYYDTSAAITLQANPAGGTFSGTGVSNQTFNPQSAGVGGPYDITYSYTDGNGCSGEATIQVSVVHANTVGIEVIPGISTIQLTPNPSNGNFEVKVNASQKALLQLTVTDATGRMVWQDNAWQVDGPTTHPVNLQQLPKGIYQLGIANGRDKAGYKVVIQ